jgi:hypothetical protein
LGLRVECMGEARAEHATGRRTDQRAVGWGDQDHSREREPAQDRVEVVRRHAGRSGDPGGCAAGAVPRLHGAARWSSERMVKRDDLADREAGLYQLRGRWRPRELASRSLSPGAVRALMAGGRGPSTIPANRAARASRMSVAPRAARAGRIQVVVARLDPGGLRWAGRRDGDQI